MAMWIDVTMSDGTGIYVRASGGYAPDVMDDLKSRTMDLMRYAASVGLQVTQAHLAMQAEALTAAEPEDLTDEVVGE